MKYAFVSDIHANLQAWEAVCADALVHQVDEIICLGDIVGYGPRPAETLRAVRSQASRFVMGNHDAVVGGILDSNLFNDDAQKMILWTKRQLTKGAARFFREMPYTVDLDCGEFWGLGVHGAMHPPESFYYVYTEADARMTWDACDAPLIFVGHTHEPRVDVLGQSGQYKCLPPDDFIFSLNTRCIVNVGSVGLPRSSDVRACYAIFDTDTYVVSWHRVAYDVASYKRDVDGCFAGEEQPSRALGVFDGDDDAGSYQDDDFSPSVVVTKKKVQRARTRMRKIQEERLTKQPGMKKETKVITIAVTAVLSTLFLLGGLGLWVLSAKRNRERQELLAQAEEMTTKPRSSPSASSNGSASNSSNSDKAERGDGAHNKRNPDFSKMPDLQPLKRPDDDKSPPVKEPTSVAGEYMKVTVDFNKSNYQSSPDKRTNSIMNVSVKPGKGRKIVLAVSWECEDGNVTATWNGHQFKPLKHSWNRRHAAILILDDPPPGEGKVKVAFPEPTQSLAGVICMRGAALGGSEMALAKRNTIKTKVSIPDSYVVGVYTSAGDGTITAPSQFKTIYNGDSGSSHGFAGYKVIPKPGPKGYTWKDTNETQSNSVIAVFAPLKNEEQKVSGPDEGKDPPDQQSDTEKGATRAWLSENVPESKDYQLLYTAFLYKLGRKIVYEKDNTGEIKGNPERIAYFLELKKKDSPSTFVYVSMDAFTNDYKKMGIPAFGSGMRFQRPVTNLTIFSNVEGLGTGTNIAGNIEFWPNSYRAENAAKVPGASDENYDTGDKITGAKPANGYGSMQIHNTKARQTIFAINKWNSGQKADIGIGNRSNGNPDWTFAENASTYTVKRLKVLVKTTNP